MFCIVFFITLIRSPQDSALRGVAGDVWAVTSQLRVPFAPPIHDHTEQDTGNEGVQVRDAMALAFEPTAGVLVEIEEEFCRGAAHDAEGQVGWVRVLRGSCDGDAAVFADGIAVASQM